MVITIVDVSEALMDIKDFWLHFIVSLLESIRDSSNLTDTMRSVLGFMHWNTVASIDSLEDLAGPLRGEVTLTVRTVLDELPTIVGDREATYGLVYIMKYTPYNDPDLISLSQNYSTHMIDLVGVMSQVIAEGMKELPNVFGYGLTWMMQTLHPMLDSALWSASWMWSLLL